MNRKIFLALIAAMLAGIVALAFVHPLPMVGSGPLMPAHAELATDCFACHVPWRGVSATRCTTCHKVADIGRKTSLGVAIVPPKPGFHQKLAGVDCLGCHTDHMGAQPPLSFSHALLAPAVQRQCATCHAAPKTPLHRNFGSDCASCHITKAWAPATFDHARYFALTGPHNVPCATCHIRQDTSRYTCYGCHEHRPDQIRAEHREVRTTNLDNCVQCHRSADGEGGEGGERGERDED